MADPAGDGQLRSEVVDVLAASAIEAGPGDIQPLGVVGLMGRVVRIPTVAGDHVVVKLPSTDSQNHGVALGFGYYQREAAFYRNVAPLLVGLVPECLGVVDRPDGSAALVLADHSRLSSADQITGASLHQAHLAVEGLAQIHSRTWQDAALVGSGLPNPLDPEVAGFGPLFELTWPGFVDAFPDLVDARVESRAVELIAGYDAASQHLATSPNCLVHGDFRLDNLLFDSNSVMVIDWQLASTGSGAYDLCRFLVGSLTPDMATAASADLTERYLDSLRRHGISDYSGDDLAADLDAAFVTYLPIPVTVAVGIASVDDRAARLKRCLAERLCAAILRRDLP